MKVMTKADWGRMLIFAIFASAMSFFLINQAAKAEKEIYFNTMGIMNMQEKQITLKTNKGDMTIELFEDKAPNTVNNFITLAKSGFYDGTKFHRVIEGFMIQGGDPLSKNDDMKDRWGTGGPGYTFDDEIYDDNKNLLGTIAMANAGPNTNGSQFFINTADNNFLDTKHTVFGKIISGRDVLMTISLAETTGPPRDRPIEPIIIEKVIVR